MEIITYGELKKTLPATRGTRVPGYMQLQEMAHLFLEKDIETGILKVYDNGFFIFESSGQRTVFGVDRCDEKGLYGDITGIDEDWDFDSYPWEVILEAAGSRRINDSIEYREFYRSVISLDEPGVENDIVFSVKPEHELKEEENDIAAMRTEKRRKMISVFRNLTDKQREVFVLKYMEHLTQDEIAEKTGLSRSAVRDRLDLVKKKFKDFL